MSEENQTQHPVFNQVQMGIGTWSWGERLFWGFGKEYGESDLLEVFELCMDYGFNFFDTAETYGQGRSETLLGRFFRESGKTVKIATKFMPYPWRLGKTSLLRALRKSLDRLGVETIDLYQVHWPFPPVTVETWMEAMASAYQSGLIRAVGVSNYDRQQMDRAHHTLIREGIRLASNQVEFNLLNRQAEKNGLLHHCQELGIQVIAYSPLAQGVLSGKYTPDHLPGGPRRSIYGRHLLTEIQPLIRLLKKIGNDYDGRTPAQVAINWAICKGTIPIPGIKTAIQLEQARGATGWRLNQEDIALLDEMSDQVTERL